MFNLLKDECKSSEPDEMSFVQKLNEYFGHHNDFVPNKSDPSCFGVNHYSGKVRYHSKDMMIKCKDYMSKNIIECFQKSDDHFISDLFLALPTPTGSFSK